MLTDRAVISRLARLLVKSTQTSFNQASHRASLTLAAENRRP